VEGYGLGLSGEIEENLSQYSWYLGQHSKKIQVQSGIPTFSVISVLKGDSEVMWQQ
jgi:hypothetical protein